MNKNEIFSLINAANVSSPFLDGNFVTSPEGFSEFCDKSKGIPILVPADKKLFYFKDEHVFELSKKHVLETVYDIVNTSYIGFKHSFYGFKFLSTFQVNAKYQTYFRKIINQNLHVKNHVHKLKKEFKNIGAFQTRNIPHFGHEKIIERLLESCDHLVINPVVGPKKSGDVVVERLTRIYRDIGRSKFGGRLSFQPITANMFYAGPREAVHHALMRQRIGFTHFTVGRDHAGAENAYQPEKATDLIEENSRKLEIKVLAHKGAAFCLECDKVILVGDCTHSVKRMLDISGSDFRTSLKEKRLFDFADKNMQQKIFKMKTDIFEP